MKLKSLILGSIAAAGLSTAGYAADLGVLTSLDVCDALGISGLTISSDTNCLQISGGVDYRLRIGDFRGSIEVADPIDENITAVGDDSFNGEDLDWDTRTRAWLRIVGTSDSDFGPASAVIGLRQVDEWRVRNGGEGTGAAGTAGVQPGGDTTDGVILDEAYVSIGDTTVITMGLRREGAAGSVANFSDDEPFSYLFSAQDAIDGDGILVNNDDDRFGGVVMQATTDVGNGISVAVGLENITNTFLRNDRNSADQVVDSVGAGTLVGVVSYAGESISAHLTAAKFGVLDDEGNAGQSADGFLVHAGVSGTFDAFAARAALGYEDNYQFRGYDLFSGLAAVQGTFDLFTLALSGEFQNFDGQTDFGLSALASAQVTEGVSINLEGTWFKDAENDAFADDRSTDSFRVVLSAAADITETIAVTAGVGTWFGDGVLAQDGGDNIIYGVVGASWSPSDDFGAGVELQVNDDGGYRGQFTASKSFN